jgi:alkylated DNA repair dioxygenase AlkB
MISGLSYQKDSISADLHLELINWLSEEKDFTSVSSSANSRKVLQYGYQYDYSRKSTQQKAEPFPALIQKVIKEAKLPVKLDRTQFNQCIVNRYLAGQGINAHIDHINYGPVIVCFTVGGGAELEFSRNDETYGLYTEPASVYVMEKDARYIWKHAMRGKLYDSLDSEKIKRTTRYSITYRMVLE